MELTKREGREALVSEARSVISPLKDIVDEINFLSFEPGLGWIDEECTFDVPLGAGPYDYHEGEDQPRAGKGPARCDNFGDEERPQGE